ncbi:hypothetical protein AB4345_05285 [Vibrio breoganii]
MQLKRLYGNIRKDVDGTYTLIGRDITTYEVEGGTRRPTLAQKQYAFTTSLRTAPTAAFATDLLWKARQFFRHGATELTNPRQDNRVRKCDIDFEALEADEKFMEATKTYREALEDWKHIDHRVRNPKREERNVVRYALFQKAKEEKYGVSTADVKEFLGFDIWTFEGEAIYDFRMFNIVEQTIRQTLTEEKDAHLVAWVSDSLLLARSIANDKGIDWW